MVKNAQKTGVVLLFHQWLFVDVTLPLIPRHGCCLMNAPSILGGYHCTWSVEWIQLSCGCQKCPKISVVLIIPSMALCWCYPATKTSPWVLGNDWTAGYWGIWWFIERRVEYAVVDVIDTLRRGHSNGVIKRSLPHSPAIAGCKHWQIPLRTISKNVQR